MDSFAKAFQKGLAKTVAVGQQQLQQRLSRYDQKNTRESAAGNTYGTGHEAQAQYVYGNQGPYQTPPAVHQQAYHSTYFPPPPATSPSPYQSHAQQGNLSYGQGQYEPTVTAPAAAPWTRQPYGSELGTAAVQDTYHGYNYQRPPPLPPRASQQPAVNDHGLSNHNQTPSCTDEFPSAAASMQQAHGRLNQQTTHPSPASPALYPPPPRVNQQGQGNTYCPYTDYSQATPYRPSEHSVNLNQGHPPAQSAEPARNPDQHDTTYVAPSPGVHRQQDVTISHPAANAATWASAANTQFRPAANTTPLQQYRPEAETAVSPPAAQTNLNPDGTPENAHPYHAPTTTLINQYNPPETKQASPTASNTAPAQQSSLPVSNTSYNGYASPDNAQAFQSVMPHYQPPPEVKQSPPAAFHPSPSSPSTSGPNLSNTAQDHRRPQNDPESIAQQMNNLSIHGNPVTPSDNTRGSSQTAKPEPPPIVASGTPRDKVQYCPEDRVIKYPLYWYQLSEMPEFLICTKCQEDHIQGTPLAGQFKRILTKEASSSTCRFWYPRVKDYLWKQALQRNSIDDLRAYATRRLTIPNCKGREATVGKQEIKYYAMRNNEIDGFITCEACYEDKIIGTAFESSFTPRNGQGAEDKWICDTSLPYLNRALASFAERNNWSGFIDEATRRLQLPACEGDSKPASEGPWYLFRRKLDNFHVCATCYMDKLELTAFEREFEAVNQNVGFDTWMEMLGQRWTCDLTSSSLPVLVALETSINAGDFDGFWATAQTISKLVPCTAKGIIRGNWWTLCGGCQDFDICEACYVGVFKTKGLDEFLEPANRDPETTLVCNFCPASPRFKQFANKYLEALDRGVFSYYADCVRKFASVPECPGIHHREKARWWGYPEALFCQDCYVGFVADTLLGAHIPIRGEFDQRAQICQVWSPRMRGLWMEACGAGEPGSRASDEQIGAFRAFGDKRLQVYLQTVPRIKFIQQMKEMRMMNAMHQGQLSLMYSGMNSMAVLSGTADGNLHGNSSLGWYETEHGATGAQMFNDMQSGFANANRTDEWMEVMRLQALWCEVE